jgi:hypothetical protein
VVPLSSLTLLHVGRLEILVVTYEQALPAVPLLVLCCDELAHRGDLSIQLSKRGRPGVGKQMVPARHRGYVLRQFARFHAHGLCQRRHARVCRRPPGAAEGARRPHTGRAAHDAQHLRCKAAQARPVAHGVAAVSLLLARDQVGQLGGESLRRLHVRRGGRRLAVVLAVVHGLSLAAHMHLLRLQLTASGCCCTHNCLLPCHLRSGA